MKIVLQKGFSHKFENKLILFQSAKKIVSTSRKITVQCPFFLFFSNQPLSIAHMVFSSFDCSPLMDARSVYLDISKAFNRVWHEGLIYILHSCGLSGNVLSLLQSFLDNRKQRTALNGRASKWGSISAGIPQCSIPGPLIFLVYINDLTANIRCDMKLFADDTSQFSTANDPSQAAADMNHDLNIIKNWPH